MKKSTDNNGKTFFEVGEARITCLPSSFTGQPGIRIQTYKPNGGLNPGPEIPLDKETAFEFLSAITQAVCSLDL